MRPLLWNMIDPALLADISMLAQDPTGLSTVWGKLVLAAIMLLPIILALRWFWHNRNR